MPDLTQKKCVSCEAGVPALTREQAKELLAQISGWQLDDSNDYQLIVRQLEFNDFKQAMSFVNKVADLAESEGHHPNIYIHSWNKVKLELYTHAIGGLSENDFIVAAKINLLS